MNNYSKETIDRIIEGIQKGEFNTYKMIKNRYGITDDEGANQLALDHMHLMYENKALNEALENYKKMEVYVLVPGHTDDFDPVAVFSDITLAEDNHIKYGGVLYTFELNEPPFNDKVPDTTTTITYNGRSRCYNE